MGLIDNIIFVLYFSALLGVGFYFFCKNKIMEDYYVVGRPLGLSAATTDAGDGFFIGLGGLGPLMVILGSWMLFTRLMGALLCTLLLVQYFKSNV